MEQKPNKYVFIPWASADVGLYVSLSILCSSSTLSPTSQLLVFPLSTVYRARCPKFDRLPINSISYYEIREQDNTSITLWEDGLNHLDYFTSVRNSLLVCWGWRKKMEAETLILAWCGTIIFPTSTKAKIRSTPWLSSSSSCDVHIWNVSKWNIHTYIYIYIWEI